MTKRNDGISLRQMRDHAQEALDLVKNLTREDIDYDRVLCLALIQLLQITGEAATRVSEEKKEATAEIKWNSIIALRNRLIHGYDSINIDILWSIIAKDLPELVERLNVEIAD
ncbi:MAG: DUF86 domain-containing protein [Nitrospinae bacterium]|nr:DUF86 domain-containing protein [Nitrospinota bacterium]